MSMAGVASPIFLKLLLLPQLPLLLLVSDLPATP
jgi:hypothetical protein